MALSVFPGLTIWALIVGWNPMLVVMTKKKTKVTRRVPNDSDANDKNNTWSDKNLPTCLEKNDSIDERNHAS